MLAPVEAGGIRPDHRRERAVGIRVRACEDGHVVGQAGLVAGIASGAAEIQLNLIATQVLQLPREPR